MVQKTVDLILLSVGYLFTFIIPGLCIVELFFSNLPKRFKFSLYLLLSVMISTYTTYLISLAIGFSRYSILISFSPFLFWFVVQFKTMAIALKEVVISQYKILIFAIVVFLIYFLSLAFGIFTKYDNYIVMSSSNWQDTAMHAGIIETISQGNFPPQAPYFSGVPLSYYYFTDFHSAILETLYGNFFPRVIIYDNPMFAVIFFLSVYLLTLEVTKKKIVAVFASLTTTFYGSFMYINFIKDVFNSGSNFLANSIELLKFNSYAIEFGKFFQVSPMADYFLQNRPMMIGLPVAVLVFSLSYYAFRKKEFNLIILSGIMTAMLIKFQFFAFLISIFIFAILSLLNLKSYGIRKIVKTTFLFLVYPIIFIILFASSSTINNNSLLNVILNNFEFIPWEENKSLLWYLSFLVSNLGLPIILFYISLPTLFLSKKISKTDWLKVAPVYLVGFMLATIPLVCRFTIMRYDMLKFYYFVEIFISSISFWFIYKFFNNKKIAISISTCLLFLTIPTSLSNLANSYLNKTMAYTESELEAGYWIRENTPNKSVFMDLANLHSPITEIGGRLRVLSYINWPHSHGYNVGLDNVFTRLEDIRTVYRNGDNYDIYKNILDKYKTNYVYCGYEERREFPNSCELLKTSKKLLNVYSNGEIFIFKIIKN